MQARVRVAVAWSLCLAGCLDAGIDEASIRITSLQASVAACGTDDRGTLRCWGGQGPELGRTDLNVPVLVPAGGNPALRRIEERFGNGCGLEGDGRAWCWGYNDYGQVGPGWASASEPVTPVATDLRFIDVALTSGTACGLATDKRIYCWGETTLGGRPGEPTDTCGTAYYRYPCLLTPKPVLSEERFSTITASAEYVCGLSAGVAHCWNWGGAPTPMDDLPALVQLDAQGFGVCGMTVDSRITCWDIYGSIEEVHMPEGVTVSSFSAGESHACILAQDQRAWCWGRGVAVGSLADTGSTAPVPVIGGLRFTSLGAGYGFTCGISTDGAWCWGSHVGDGSGVSRPIPTRVAGQGTPDD